MPDWRIERLAGNHDRTGFDCGKPSLSDWVRLYAGQNETRDVARTYVAVRPGATRVHGYYCLSTGHVSPDSVPADRAKKLPPNQAVPVALIGKLAVDRTAHRRGLGAVLLVDALARTQRLAHEIGIHAVVVDAIDDEARGFYLKFGFEPLLDDPLHLFITLKVVRKLKLVAPAD